MRKLALGLIVFLLVGLVSAQSLQNFEYSPEKDYSVGLTGGESFNQSINFTNEADKRLDFGLRVTVENESTNFVTGENKGAEFDLSAYLNDSNSTRSLSFKERLSNGDLVYIGSLPDSDSKLENLSSNSLEVKVSSNPAIAPDTFDFRFEVRSVPGFASETETTNVSNGSAEVEVEENEVEINLDDNDTEANVTVESYEETTTAPPEPEESFVGGVGVEVEDNESNDVEANGTVSIGYSQTVVDNRDLVESSMDVHFYNGSSQTWTTEGVDVVNRDTENNVVEAEVSHFSTYAAFAPEEEPEEVSYPAAGEIIDYEPQEEDDTEENETETVQNQTEDTDQTGEGSDTQEQEDETSQQGQEGTGTEESDLEGSQESEDTTDEEGESQAITGEFFTSDTGTTGGILIILLAALVIFLEYTGRIEIRELKQVVKQKLSS